MGFVMERFIWLDNPTINMKILRLRGHKPEYFVALDLWEVDSLLRVLPQDSALRKRMASAGVCVVLMEKLVGSPSPA